MSKVLIVIAPKNFRDEEYFEPKQIIEAAGHLTTTVSTVTGEIIGSHGKTAIAEVMIKDINVNEFDAVLFVGGQGSYVYDTNKIVHNVAQQFYKQGKLVTAICHAPIILAKAGLLKEENATVFSGDSKELANLGVNYQNQPVVIGNNIITADGPQSAEMFGEAIVAAFAK